MSPAIAQVNGPGPSPANLFDTVLNLPGDEAVVTGAAFESIGDVPGQTTQLNVSDGGAVGFGFEARSGSEVNISGGDVGDRFDADSGSEVNVSGGTVGCGFEAFFDSTVNISGGSFAGNFEVFNGSNVELVGGEFRLNGASFSGSTITLAFRDVFTGTFADGSSFIFSPNDGFGSDRLSNVTVTTAAALPAAGPAPIVINAPVVSGPSGLRAGQTLTLQDGGSLRDNFAVVGATLNIEGGSLGNWAEASNAVVNISGGDIGFSSRFYLDSEINISGGNIGGIDVLFGSVVNISGGNVGGGVNSRSNAFSGSEVNISGGTVGEILDLHADSVVNISGGTVDGRLEVNSGSELNISGGTVGGLIDILAGSVVNISGGALGVLSAPAGSDAELIGGEFRLNGVDFSGTSITLADDDIFSGTLADGSPFIFCVGLDTLVDVSLTASALPAATPTPIVVNAPDVSGPLGLRAGQTLTLQAGGSLSENFSVVDATLNVEGGTVSEGGEAYNSVVNISGGSLGGTFDAFSGSEINISGGTVGDNFEAFFGSTVNISGGNVGDRFQARPGSEVNISGGTVNSGFEAGFQDDGFQVVHGGFRFGNTVVNISGGTLGTFRAQPGSIVNVSGGTVARLTAGPSSVINISGSEFFIAGEELDTLVLGEAFTITDRDVTLSGILADGTAFSFDLNPFNTFQNDSFDVDATLTVTLGASILLGDVSRNGVVDFLDIAPFIAVLASGGFQDEADTDRNDFVNFLDIAPFIAILSGL